MTTSGHVSGILTSDGHVTIVSQAVATAGDALEFDGDGFVDLCAVVEGLLRRINTRDAYLRLENSLRRIGEASRPSEDWQRPVREAVGMIPRCVELVGGWQCRLEHGHSEPHEGYPTEGEIQWPGSRVEYLKAKPIRTSKDIAAAGIDPDAHCPEHGCARWRCDAKHGASS